jgi:hypothetical protein
VIINALTKRKGAKTALIVTRSFRTGDSGNRESLDAADGAPDPAGGDGLADSAPHPDTGWTASSLSERTHQLAAWTLRRWAYQYICAQYR